MAILTGTAIRWAIDGGAIKITPFDPERINPASYDVRLGRKLLVPDASVTDTRVTAISPIDGKRYAIRDVEKPTRFSEIMMQNHGLTLWPGVLYLGHTIEVMSSSKYVAHIDGKSSVGREGITVHVTAGYIDPGYQGQITLEIHVVEPIHVIPGMRIAQLRFETVEGSIIPYQTRGSYVHGNIGPTPSSLAKQVANDRATGKLDFLTDKDIPSGEAYLEAAVNESCLASGKLLRRP